MYIVSTTRKSYNDTRHASHLSTLFFSFLFFTSSHLSYPPLGPHKPPSLPSLNLDKLLESAVNRRADVRDILPEVHGGDSALGDALWGELELLYGVSVIYSIL
jgi:hypothetical protein